MTAYNIAVRLEGAVGLKSNDVDLQINRSSDGTTFSSQCKHVVNQSCVD